MFNNINLMAKCYNLNYSKVFLTLSRSFQTNFDLIELGASNLKANSIREGTPVLHFQFGHWPIWESLAVAQYFFVSVSSRPA